MTLAEQYENDEQYERAYEEYKKQYENGKEMFIFYKNLVI